MEKYKVVLTTQQTIYVDANSLDEAISIGNNDMDSFYDSSIIESDIVATKEDK